MGQHADYKRKWSLLPWAALAPVVDAFAYGDAKYLDGGAFRHTSTPERADLFTDKALRHLVRAMTGQTYDPETGLPHLAHAVADLLIALTHQYRIQHGEAYQTQVIESPPPEGVLRRLQSKARDTP